MSFNTNFNNIGGVTISSSYVASGFSSSKYLQLKEPWVTGDYDTLEAVWAFTITSLSTNNSIIGRTNVYGGLDGDRSINISQSATSQLCIQLCSTGTTYDIGSITFTDIVANTKYWVKLTYADGVYTSQLSTDGFATVAQTYTINSTLKLRSGVKQLLGTYEGYNYGFNGTIDLLQCYFKINGETVWTPYSDNPGSVTVGKGLYRYNDGTEISMTEAQTKGPDTLFDTKARKANLFVYRDSDNVSSFMASALTQPTASPEGKTLSAVQSLNTPIYLNAAMDMIVSNPTAVFTITPTPSTATVTINDVVQTSIEVDEDTSVTWSVAADGYVTQSGTETVTADTAKTVTLEEESTVVQPTLPTDTFYAWTQPDSPTATAWYSLTETPTSNDWMYVANAGDYHSLATSQSSGVAYQTLEQIGGAIDGTTLTAQGLTFERNSSYDGEFYLCRMWMNESDYEPYLTKNETPVTGDVVYHWIASTGAVTNSGTVGTKWTYDSASGKLTSSDSTLTAMSYQWMQTSVIENAPAIGGIPEVTSIL